jgi:hypothetical protein
MVTDIVDTSFSGLASTGGLRSGCVLRQPRHPETPVCGVENAPLRAAPSRIAPDQWQRTASKRCDARIPARVDHGARAGQDMRRSKNDESRTIL